MTENSVAVDETAAAPGQADPTRDPWQKLYKGKPIFPSYSGPDVPRGSMRLYIHPNVTAEELADAIIATLDVRAVPAFSVSKWVRENLDMMASMEDGPPLEGWFITEDFSEPLYADEGEPKRLSEIDKLLREEPLKTKGARMMNCLGYLVFVWGYRQTHTTSWPDVNHSTQLTTRLRVDNSDLPLNVSWGSSGNFYASPMPKGDAPHATRGVRLLCPVIPVPEAKT